MTWIGLLLGGQRRAADERAIYRAVRAEAIAAAEGGFSVLVAPEHAHAEPYRMLQPWPLLGAVREATGGEVATVASVIAGLTTAERLAADIATLRAIGDGAAGVALAAGYRRADFAAAGRDFETRFERRGAILAALAADSDGCEPGWLWSAAGTTRAAQRAAASGVPWYGAPTLDAGRAAAIGGDVVLRRDVLLADGPADLADRARRFVEPKYGAYAAWGYGDGDAGAVVAGEPGEVAGALGRLITTLRPRGLVLRLCWPDMDGDQAAAHVRAFARDVVPALPSPDAAAVGVTR